MSVRERLKDLGYVLGDTPAAPKVAWWQRVLDWICPRIGPNQPIPYGLSLGRQEHGYATDLVRLHLPLWYWRGVSYRVDEDVMRRGWWLLAFVIRVVPQPNGFNVEFRCGNFQRGNGMVRLHPEGPWIEERSL